jgi:diguanylate cyclase (GGDEF)-like protein
MRAPSRTPGRRGGLAPRGWFAVRGGSAEVVVVGAFLLWCTGLLWQPGRGWPAVWETVYDGVLYVAVFLAAAGVCWRVAGRAPRESRAWRALAGALVLHSAGDVTVAVLDLRGGVPAVSAADAMYLCAFPLVYTAIFSLLRARVERFHPSMWLDGLIGALGAAGLTVAAVLSSSAPLDAAGLPQGTLAAMVNLAYPVSDLLLLVLLVGMVAVLGLTLDAVLVLLAAGLVCGLVGDGMYAQQVADGTYRPGGWVYLMWLLVAVATVAAARHRLAHPSPRVTPASSRVGWRVLALPMASSLLSLGLLGLGWGSRFSPLAAVCAIACVLAGLGRLAMTFREVRALADAREQAMTDDLTGLPNRRALLAAAAPLLDPDTPIVGPVGGDRWPSRGGPAALLLLDLDGFKDVNDALGHSAGDELLRAVGARLGAVAGPDPRPDHSNGSTLPAPGMLARLGGDEFAILLPATPLPAAVAYAECLLKALSGPFAVGGIRVHVGASVGVAAWDDSAPRRTGPVDDQPAPVLELLRRADVAMYAAKSHGGGVHTYTDRADGATGDRLRLVDELRTALDSRESEPAEEELARTGPVSATTRRSSGRTPLDRHGAPAGQLLIHLQPQIDIVTGGPCGTEALVRWQHPTRGLLMPGDLLPAAARAGLLLPLADRVLDLALAAAAGRWTTHPVAVSVNLAAPNVTDVDLPGKITTALARHGLPSAALTLELVEDMLMTDPVGGRHVLRRLQELGVRTSIDDYGTGYSSLAYLRTLPVDELKLDKAFTADLADDRHARAIVTHTVALGHDLGLRVVAEGVEDGDTFDRLALLGCDAAQGYFIARPLPVADFTTWLTSATRAGADPRRQGSSLAGS